MTPEQFTYWCQGFVEVTNGKRPSDKQWRTITDHLALVFKKETPNRFDVTPDPSFLLCHGGSPIPMRDYIASLTKDANTYSINPDGSPVVITHTC